MVFTAENAQQCPSCKAVFTKAAKYCPHCGVLLEAAAADKTHIMIQPKEAADAEQMNKAGYIIRKANRQKIMLNNRPGLLIGSSKYECDYCVNSSGVSRRHAEIIRRETRYFINDLGSSNHTYVNGEQLVPHSERMLRDQDVIKMADEEFIFGLE